MPGFPKRTLEHRIDTYRAAVAYHGSIRKAAAALGISKSALHRWTTGEVNIHSPRTSHFIDRTVGKAIVSMTPEERLHLRRATVIQIHQPSRVTRWAREPDLADFDVDDGRYDDWVDDEFGYS